MKKSAKQLVMRRKFRPKVEKAKKGKGSYERKSKRENVDESERLR